ncbi:MAG: undecaprenyldiphospho-muramoylpentapeptide beta-N-acetylglucosaminyltransferase [Clostridiales bacterium]|nr:undecaprenyldiphospho-muramoylpentapeptide beta-N-acetylglucosaminyltransferase [Clostridiales bacterium]
MRVIITGGGSGGHVYPAIAIADKFKEKDPNTEILYIGYMYGFEKDVVPKAGYKMEEIDTCWVDRSNPIRLLHTLRYVNIGIRSARKIIKKFKPDVIVGTGGFVCFPVIFPANRMGIPCFVHEQNAFPGLSNRTLEKYVKKIFLGFEEGGRFFKDQSKLVTTGNPVRKSFYEIKKEDARKKLGFKEDDFVVLSFGGSLGAEAINSLAMGLVEEMNGKEGQVLIFGTGKQYYDNVMEEISKASIELADNVKVMNYIDDMDNYIAASDLVVSRAGALTVAETLVQGKPSILVPSPNVTGNHQYFNAKAVADNGAAILIEEKDADPDRIREILRELRANPEKLSEMGKKAKECAPGEATEIIYDEVMKTLGK